MALAVELASPTAWHAIFARKKAPEGAGIVIEGASNASEGAGIAIQAASNAPEAAKNAIQVGHF